MLLACLLIASGCAFGPWEVVNVSPGPTRRAEVKAVLGVERQLLVERDAMTLSVIVRDARRCQLRVRESRIERVDEARKPTPFLFIDAGLMIASIVAPFVLVSLWGSEDDPQQTTDAIGLAVLGGLPTSIVFIVQVTRKRQRSRFREVELANEVYPAPYCSARLVAHQGLQLVFSDGTMRNVETDERGAVQARVPAELGVEIRMDGSPPRRVPPYAQPDE